MVTHAIGLAQPLGKAVTRFVIRRRRENANGVPVAVRRACMKIVREVIAVSESGGFLLWIAEFWEGSRRLASS